MMSKVKLEIGCGNKRPHRSDFIGLDRFSMPGVDIVCDLDNERIPLPDDHCDLVYASHSLEHVRDLVKVMREIWRVCKSGAQLVIVAPYYSTTLNFSNPYHHQNFNEHTPRFWTTAPVSQVNPAEYDTPFAWDQPWGLAQSDNSAAQFDFRTIRMEMFYFAKYHWLPADVRINLRQTRMNICHSIMYHLMAFKPPMNEADIVVNNDWFYIPPEAAHIRATLNAMPKAAFLRRIFTLLGYRIGL